MKKNLNQKLIGLVEYYNLINTNLLLSDIPLKRNINNTTTSFSGTKVQKLEKLKNYFLGVLQITFSFSL